MNYMDYRERLGIGFDDSDKRDLFITRVHGRFVQGVSLNISPESERAFCYEVGAICELDRSAANPFPEFLSGSRESGGLARVWSDYFDNYDQQYPRFPYGDEDEDEEDQEEDSRLEFCEFLALVVTLRNCCKGEVEVCEYLTKAIDEALKESYIPFEWVDGGDGDLFVFPQGAHELDNALVSEPLEWLSGWPYSRKAFVEAL